MFNPYMNFSMAVQK